LCTAAIGCRIFNTTLIQKEKFMQKHLLIAAAAALALAGCGDKKDPAKAPEAPKQEAKKEEPKKEEAKKEETKAPEAPKAEEKKDEPKKEETKK
jgi:ABC-type uncharacterized transport system auxiliary subunit